MRLRFKFLYKHLEVGKVSGFLVINLEHLLSFEELISWSTYRTSCKSITNMVKNRILEIKAEKPEALLPLEELARDVLEELTNNLNKDISKNKDFWNKMHKKYEPETRETNVPTDDTAR